MTVALILPDRIVSDSRLNWGESHHTVGKIFRRPDGALFVTAGDSRLTYPFEQAMLTGEEPEQMDVKDTESFEGVLLRVDGKIITYDENFAPSLISETWTAIGSGGDVARSWYKHGHAPALCIERVFEVRADCGPPVVTVMLHEEKQPRRRR